jgi:hypothetical protein
VYTNYSQLKINIYILKITQICDIVVSISDNNPCSNPGKKRRPDNSSHESWPTPAAGKPHSVLVKNTLENLKVNFKSHNKV